MFTFLHSSSASDAPAFQGVFVVPPPVNPSWDLAKLSEEQEFFESEFRSPFLASSLSASELD